MRGLLFFISLFAVYYAIKTVFRSAVKAYHDEDGRKKIQGEELVLDPECRTYVVKDRAVTRRIRGSSRSFCSEACARRYEDRQRD